MQQNAPLKNPMKVGDLLKKRLKDNKQTPAQLAEAVEVPPEYIEDIISGRRRPPLPGRTDIYERMTRFLRLGRNELVDSARAERGAKTSRSKPVVEVLQHLMELCQPETAKALERRAKKDDSELREVIGRVLDVAQGSVRRVLEDTIALRISATQNGVAYINMRLRVLEFLDATPDTLTPEDLAYFVRPQIELWDLDLETGVLRVVLRTRQPEERGRRRPIVRRGGMRLAG